jgi:hypothetical protein
MESAVWFLLEMLVEHVKTDAVTESCDLCNIAANLLDWLDLFC